MSDINEFILFWNQENERFGVRRTTEVLPSGSAPAAVVCEGRTVWQADWGSVSFPYARAVEFAVQNFVTFEKGGGDYLGWTCSEMVQAE